MRARIDGQSWSDWVLFAAAYGVIMGAILFAYPPAQSAARQDASAQTTTLR